METPEVWTLALIDWQFYGTLTFKQARLPERIRDSMWNAMIRKTAKAFGIHPKKMLTALSPENGEIGGRFHYHYLLAGLPRQGINIASCFAQMSHWEQMGGGMARVYLFDPSLNGIGYITKCLGEKSDVAGLCYETAKMGASLQLRLSPAAQKVTARRAMRQRRR